MIEFDRMNGTFQDEHLNSLAEQYHYDFKRYSKYSTTIPQPRNKEQLEARIRADTHMIEKGFSLPEPRLGFGKEHIDLLMMNIDQYIKEFQSSSHDSITTAISVLQEYIRYHEERGYNVNVYQNKILEMGIIDDEDVGGKRDLKKEEILRHCQSSFREFASNRFSIRNYSDEPVSIDLLKKAIEIAQKTPSVCNRQTCKVYIVADRLKKREVLSYHDGNRGFGHLADKILIVTSDLRSFEGVHERNQSFVDGGMFAMSLLYGLHYEGLATCTMNWCTTKEQDLQLRKIIPLQSAENVILLVAVGHIPAKIAIAKSNRKPLSDVFTIV